MIGLLASLCTCLLADGFMLNDPPLIRINGECTSNGTIFENISLPLYITPFLEKGEITRAQELSQVFLPNKTSLKSFSGYFTVNKTCESNLFFWFFPAQKDWEEAPVVLWLQGGPGASSLYGLFEETGPISYEGELSERQYSWNRNNNLLFIDQPVGTGFSFTRRGCYATTDDEASTDLYFALTQFFVLFQNLQNNKFYIAGESYAGHYVPSVALIIHKMNPAAKIKINLTGLMIGNGLMDRYYQSDYGSYLFQLGMINSNQRGILNTLRGQMMDQISKESWVSALNYSRSMVHSFSGFIGNVSIYNYLSPSADPETPKLWESYINQPEIREALHVGKEDYFRISENVSTYLELGIVKSVKQQVEELLEHYPVVFYYGQLDILCAYPLAVDLLRSLDWSGAGGYLEAERRQWCVQGELAGYWKSAQNLHEVLVRAAGHMVPRDQPLWAFQLMDSVTSSPARDPLGMLTDCLSK